MRHLLRKLYGVNYPTFKDTPQNHLGNIGNQIHLKGCSRAYRSHFSETKRINHSPAHTSAGAFAANRWGEMGICTAFFAEYFVPLGMYPKKGQPLPYKHYIWQVVGFPHELTWDSAAVFGHLLPITHELGRLYGKVESMGKSDLEETFLQNAIEAVKASSAIEGDLLHYHDVRSSVAKQLGIQRHGLLKEDARTDAIVRMMTDAMDIEQVLATDRLMTWHGLLFPDGPLPKVGLYHVAEYRDVAHDPMVVVSGQPGKEKVHFQAPPADTLPMQMELFLNWCNDETQEVHPIIKSAVAHFWFVTLHPFDDGNGRLARAIGDYFMAKADLLPHRFYSLSSAILANRAGYYQALEQSQKGGLDITAWILWYLTMVQEAVQASLKTVEQVMAKTRFWMNHDHLNLNLRQKKVLNLLLTEYTSTLKTDKYAKLTKTSPDSALRDLKELVQLGVLKQVGQGKATAFELV